jgi:hypothetical protein
MRPMPIEEQTLEGGYRGYAYLKSYSREDWDALSAEKQQTSKTLGLSLLLKDQMLGQVREDDSWKTLQAWVVRDDKTIVVETTTQDLEDLDDYKTPQAVIRRINKVRDSFASYPKKLPVIPTTK